MNVRSIVCLIIGAALVVVASVASPAPAAPPADVDAKKIDQAIQSYEGRAEGELEQTKKDVERLQKELSELVQLRYELTVSLAELKAEEGAEASPAAGAENQGDGQAKSSDDSKHHRRVVELNREYQRIQEAIRTSIQNTRGETDQIVTQLRGIRAQRQQREQRRDQLKASREHKKGPEPKNSEQAQRGSRDRRD